MGCVYEKVVLTNATGVRIDSDQTGPPTEDYTFTILEMVFIISELRNSVIGIPSLNNQLLDSG